MINLAFLQLLYIILLWLIPSVCLSQDCQGSYDREDLDGERIEIRREFRCGTGMMANEMHYQREHRESLGYFNIEGFTFYDTPGYYQKEGKLYFSPHADTFKLIANGDIASLKYEGNFIRDKDNVYSAGNAVESVNIKSFKDIPDSPYAKDDSRVYYNARKSARRYNAEPLVIEGADAATFGPLCDNDLNGQCYYYAKDANNVYYTGKLIEGADVSTFRVNENGYAIDANYVYYGGEPFEGSSGSTFEEITYQYSKDENNVYHYGSRIPEMNGSTFRLIGDSGMGTDDNLICYGSTIYENGDPATFVDLGCGFYKDVNNVYSKGQIMNSMDPASFEILQWGFIKDKNAVYCDGEIIPGADPQSFEVLGRKYSRDKKRVFYLRSTLDDCHRGSFEVDDKDPSKAKDSRGRYYRGERGKKK